MIRLFFTFYFMLAGSVFIYVASEGIIRTHFLHNQLVSDSIDDYSGAFYFVNELHKELDTEAFNAVIAHYPDDSNLPIAVLSKTELNDSNKIQQELEVNDIYVADTETDILYSRLNDTDFVVRVGPIGTHAPLLLARSIYQLSLFVVLALPVFFLIFNLHRKIKRLENATTHFGKGDFSVRVSEQAGYRVGELNGTFNLMAEKVERLIEGHKYLTNAVAHELRTPVSRVRFELDMLYRENDELKRKEYMHGISDDLNELSGLVDELLTYARFDRQPVALTMHSHSLHQSIQNVIKSVNFNSQMEVNYDDSWCIPDQSLQYIRFDPHHLERAISNLVSNAVKYGRSSVNVSVKRTGQVCSVIIDDNGPGIPLESRDSVFEPFKRLDHSRTRKTGGYGLGLAIVKQVAQWHGGTVSVEESPLGGARFVISWPV